MDAAAGASSTTSPSPATAAANRTACGITSQSRSRPPRTRRRRARVARMPREPRSGPSPMITAALQAAPVGRDEFADVDALSRPPTIHTTDSNDASDARRRAGWSPSSRRPRDAAVERDGLGAVVVDAEARQGVADDLGATRPHARASADAASMFATMCGAPRPARPSSPSVVSSRARVTSVVEERAVDEDVARRCRGRSARARRDRSRSLGSPRRPRRPRPSAASPRRPCCRRTRRACSRRPVALASTYASREPCQSRWSSARLRHTLATGCERSSAGRLDPVQLEARQLDDEHVEADRVADRIEHGHADVADGAARGPPRRACGSSAARSWSCRSCR